MGLIGPNAGRAGELELELGARSLRRRMTAGCHQNRTSQGSFRMLCDGARTNLQVRVAQTSQVRSLCRAGWGDGMDVVMHNVLCDSWLGAKRGRTVGNC